MDIKKLPKSKVEFKISVAWNDWKKFLDEAVVEISKDVKVEGFRAGKASRKIIEQKVGKESILSTAAQKTIEKIYPKKVKEMELDVIGSPEINIINLVEGSDLEFSIISAVMPKIKLKKDWKEGVKKVNADYAKEKIEIADKDALVEIEKIAKSRAKLVTVKRATQKEDSVVLDFEVKRDGIIIEGGSAKDHNLILGSNVFIPGFEEEIIGLKEGDDKEFELKFPKEYHEKNLAGKPAQFSVKLKLVQEREIPKVDDEFAKSLGEFKTLDDLVKNIKEGMSKEQKFKMQEKRRGDIVEVLVDKIEAEDEFPEIIIHEEIHKMMSELEGQIQQTGMNLTDYLEKLGKNTEQLEKDWEPQAIKRIKAALALENIIKEKEIEISSEKIEEAMNKTLQFYKNEKDLKNKIDMKRLYDYTSGMLKNEEVFKMLEKI